MKVTYFKLLLLLIYSLAFKYWRQGTGEFYRSFRTKQQVKLLQKYVPEIKLSDIEPGIYESGIRAQALDENGKDNGLFDQF